MSDNTTPIEPFFELQRETITQTVSLLTGPRRLGRSLTADGAAASRHAQEQTLELSRRATHRLLGASEGLGSDRANDRLHEGIDDVFDQLTDHQTATLTALDELRESADQQLGARLVAQVALLLRVNESLERQAAVTAEQIEDELLDDQSLAADLEDTIEELSAALTESAQRLDAVEIPVDTAATEEDAATADTESEASTAVEEGADEVRCRVCGERFGAITHSHLQTHDTTIAAYTEEFEDAPLRPEDRE